MDVLVIVKKKKKKEEIENVKGCPPQLEWSEDRKKSIHCSKNSNTEKTKTIDTVTY